MNRKGRSSHSFVMLRHDMLKSEAYRSLSPADRAVYVEILLRYNGYNNGEIPLSCREAARLCNIGTATANRSFGVLQERGFIKVGIPSGFNVKVRRSTRWILTQHAIDEKIAPTNEWKTWKPSGQI